MSYWPTSAYLVSFARFFERPYLRVEASDGDGPNTKVVRLETTNAMSIILTTIGSVCAKLPFHVGPAFRWLVLWTSKARNFHPVTPNLACRLAIDLTQTWLTSWN